jgi:hypothetical protein
VFSLGKYCSDPYVWVKYKASTVRGCFCDFFSFFLKHREGNAI